MQYNADLRFEDLRLVSLLKTHKHGERRISDVHGSMQIEIVNLDPDPSSVTVTVIIHSHYHYHYHYAL
jgi:hypothetical protein